MPNVSKGLSAERVGQLPVSGAASLLAALPTSLRAQIIAIDRTFPELALARRRRAIRQSVQKAERRGRKMSAAARKEVSVRMKKYWAERRKAKAQVK
jgi:hypothetical protein